MIKENIQLINGDSIEELEQLINNKIKELNLGGMFKKDNFNKGKVFNNNNININIKDWMPLLYDILEDNYSHAYIMTNDKNLQEMLNEATKVGFKFVRLLTWNKGNKVMGQY